MAKRSLSLALALLSLASAPERAPAQKRSRSGFLRGICYTSYEAGRQSRKKILDWVENCRINLVAIDFFGVAYNHDRTDYAGIARLAQRLRKKKVTVLVDYRPSTSTPGKAVQGEGPDLCLSDPEVRKNIIGWGLYLLDKVPDTDILTIYNPMPRFERNKHCERCKKIGENKLLQIFFEEWSTAIRKKHPRVKLGATFVASPALYRSLEKYLDVFTPFCSLIAAKGKTEAGPGHMKRVASSLRPLIKKRPIIPLVKLYWKQETRNSTADILSAMDEAKAQGLAGFFLWYRSLLTGDVAKRVKFKLPEYDMDAIVDKYRELAGEKRRRHKNRKKGH